MVTLPMQYSDGIEPLYFKSVIIYNFMYEDISIKLMVIMIVIDKWY